VRVHQGERNGVQEADDVLRGLGGPKQRLRVAEAPAVEPCEDARPPRLIRASFTASHGIYGAPRVFLDLREAGESCSKHCVERLMGEDSLRGLHGYRVRRQSVGKPAILIPSSPQRQFTATRANRAWVTDITFIRMWQGWLQLAVVLDLFPRRVVGWATSPTIHREVALNAVLMAGRPRRPRGTLIHRDQ
jgi:putative transposase